MLGENSNLLDVINTHRGKIPPEKSNLELRRMIARRDTIITLFAAAVLGQGLLLAVLYQAKKADGQDTALECPVREVK